MTKALFLDRDGVLNRELGRYVTSLEEFEVLPTVPGALRLAAGAGFLLVIISNQGGVAKGLYTMDTVLAMQAELQRQLDVHGVSIAEGYYCPHHPDHGRCLCRKPQPLMLEKAIARFSIDRLRSFMIGDSPRDLEAAGRAGVTGLPMPPNGDLLEVIRTLV